MSGGSGNKATSEEQSGDTQPLVPRDIPASDKTRNQFGDSVYPFRPWTN